MYEWDGAQIYIFNNQKFLIHPNNLLNFASINHFWGVNEIVIFNFGRV